MSRFLARSWDAPPGGRAIAFELRERVHGSATSSPLPDGERSACEARRVRGPRTIESHRALTRLASLGDLSRHGRGAPAARAVLYFKAICDCPAPGGGPLRSQRVNIMLRAWHA